MFLAGQTGLRPETRLRAFVRSTRFGLDPDVGEITTSRHARHIIKRILWQMQANRYGGLSKSALARANKLADMNRLRLTLPRLIPASEDAQTVSRSLPGTITSNQSDIVPGTQIERMYKGQRIVVTIMDNGVRFNGELYSSLSAVAQAITGTHWNGKLFFGLTRKENNHGRNE
jgi:hypothetical protein